VVVIDGEVNELDVTPAALVKVGVPPVRAVYHLNCPAVALVADSTTVPVPHRDPGVPVGAVQATAQLRSTAKETMTSVRSIIRFMAFLVLVG
jgi:hypothetical protein